MNIKILACQIIGPAAAGCAGPVPTALLVQTMRYVPASVLCNGFGVMQTMSVPFSNFILYVSVCLFVCLSMPMYASMCLCLCLC